MMQLNQTEPGLEKMNREGNGLGGSDGGKKERKKENGKWGESKE